MPVAVRIRDESMKGETLRECMLEFLTEETTVRELIRSRVYQEVREYNARKPGFFQGLVQPTDAEKTLNGYKLRDRKKLIDWEKQYQAAVDAFESKQILILVDNEQVDKLENVITVGPETTVTFIKLVFLAGG